MQVVRTRPNKLSWAVAGLFYGQSEWVKTAHNDCGLTCILGLVSGPNNQVSLALTTQELSAKWNGAPPQARGGEEAIAPSCRTPHGHDQTLREFFKFSMFVLTPPQVEQTPNCNSSIKLRNRRLAAAAIRNFEENWINTKFPGVWSWPYYPSTQCYVFPILLCLSLIPKEIPFRKAI